MNCPKCGQPMERGYVQGSRGVLFAPMRKIYLVRNPLDKRQIKIAGCFASSSPAEYCYACGVLVWQNPDKEK